MLLYFPWRSLSLSSVGVISVCGSKDTTQCHCSQMWTELNLVRPRLSWELVHWVPTGRFLAQTPSLAIAFTLCAFAPQCHFWVVQKPLCCYYLPHLHCLFPVCQLGLAYSMRLTQFSLLSLNPTIFKEYFGGGNIFSVFIGKDDSLQSLYFEVCLPPVSPPPANHWFFSWCLFFTKYKTSKNKQTNQQTNHEKIAGK